MSEELKYELGWRAQGSGAEATIGPGLLLSVYWEGLERLGNDEPKYNVYVFGQRLKLRAPSLDDGKRRAEAAAKKWMTAALEQLT